MMASCSRPTKQAKGESTIGPNWLELPRELTENILQRVGVVGIVTSARQVCSLWWNICKNPLMWRTIDMTTHPYACHFILRRIFHYALERSSGYLEEISIENFANDKLLKYIVDRTSNLRRMRLVNCPAISDRGLCKVVKKLPLLEELEISYRDLYEVDTLKFIGRSCPRLKKLKFNHMNPSIIIEGNDEALAIAKTMPELCHLELSGNSLTDDGLLAILNGCPHLETLHLRDCYHVDLSGSLGERCHAQIKDLQVLCDYQVKHEKYNFYFGNESNIQDLLLGHYCHGFRFQRRLRDLIGNLD